MTQDWTHLTDWWLDEADAPAYEEEVLPLFLSVFAAGPDDVVLDLGCGDGRLMDEIAARGVEIVGVDINRELARHARHPVAVDSMPLLSAIADRSVDGAYIVLSLEHVDDSAAFFAHAARIVRSSGRLTMVINHPVYTAPNSGPILDPSDGELFWRFGDYLSTGSTTEPAGDEEVEFLHRPIGQLLTEAATAGWQLEEVREQGVGAAAADRDPILAKHHHIPHLMALRWRRA